MAYDSRSFFQLIRLVGNLLSLFAIILAPFFAHGFSTNSFSTYNILTNGFSADILKRPRNVYRCRPEYQLKSISQTSLHSSVTDAVGALDNFYHTAPYASAFMTCSIKASAADLVAQTSSRSDTYDVGYPQSKEADIDSRKEHPIIFEGIEPQRNIAFILYGGLYQGMAQQFIYGTIFPSIFGTGTEFQTVCLQVLFDLVIISPFLCLPVAYLTKASIYGQTPQQGLENYWNDLRFKGLLNRYWSLWLPAEFITFGLIPLHLRILFIAFISFFWLVMLSKISSSNNEMKPVNN